MKSKLFGCLDALATSHRVLLTGTPLQNNLIELFSIMKILRTGKEEFQDAKIFESEFSEIIDSTDNKKPPKDEEIQKALNGESSETVVDLTHHAEASSGPDTSQETVDYGNQNKEKEKGVPVSDTPVNKAAAEAKEEKQKYLASSPGHYSSPIYSPDGSCSDSKDHDDTVIDGDEVNNEIDNIRAEENCNKLQPPVPTDSCDSTKPVIQSGREQKPCNADRLMQIKRLHKIIAPHFLRRLKRDVLRHLPPKVSSLVL